MTYNKITLSADYCRGIRRDAVVMETIASAGQWDRCPLLSSQFSVYEWNKLWKTGESSAQYSIDFVYKRTEHVMRGLWASSQWAIVVGL